MTTPTAPVPDQDSAPYWQGLRHHRLVLQRCTACSRHRFPAMPSCPYCSSLVWVGEEVPGRGTIFSWIVVHHAFAAAFRSDVPYVIATVELECGPRLLGRFDGGDPDFGLPVVGTFVDHEEWTELRFVPDPSSTAPAAQ